jgi:hypothetical protein
MKKKVGEDEVLAELLSHLCWFRERKECEK